MSATTTASWVRATLPAAIDRFNAGDPEGVVEMCSPEVEFSTFLGRFEGRSYRGIDGVREWFRNIFEAFPGFRLEVHSIEVTGEVAVVEVTFHGTGAASGISLEERLFQRVELRDRRVTGWSWHPTQEAASQGTAEAAPA